MPQRTLVTRRALLLAAALTACASIALAQDGPLTGPGTNRAVVSPNAQQTPPAAPTLAVLRAAAMRRYPGRIERVAFADGQVLPARTFTIELPDTFHPRDDLGGPFGYLAGFEIDFGAPRFYVRHAMDAQPVGAHLAQTAYGCTAVRGHGERAGVSWASRAQTTRPSRRRLDAASARPLPRGERAWIELDVATQRVTPDGARISCTADLAPFARRLHGTTQTAIEWLVDRCASVVLDDVAR